MDWRFRFCIPVNETLGVILRPGRVKYSEILALERKFRACTMPEGLETPAHGSLFDNLPEDAEMKHIQRYAAILIREIGAPGPDGEDCVYRADVCGLERYACSIAASSYWLCNTLPRIQRKKARSSIPFFRPATAHAGSWKQPVTCTADAPTS